MRSERTTVSVTSGSLAFLLNLLLSYIIYSTRINTLGKYKHLLFLYTLSATVYASNQVLTAAEFVVCPSGYLMYDTLNVLPTSIAIISIENYAVCFLVLLTIISWCFVYRYYVALRTTRLDVLHRNWKFLSGLTLLVLFMVLFCSLYSCFPREAYYWENSSAFYNLTGRYLNSTAYNCGPITIGGQTNWQVYWGLSQFTLFIFLCGMINVYCAIRIASFLRKSFAESNTTLKRQTRIFTLLLLQFIFPLSFNMMPVFLVFLAAYFHLPTFNLEVFVGPIVSIAQIIDPLLIFFFISDYRKTAKGMFRRERRIQPETQPEITFSVYN